MPVYAQLCFLKACSLDNVPVFAICTVSTFLIGLYHPLDGVTNHKYKLLHFLTIFFYKEKNPLAFKWVLPSSALITADSLPFNSELQISIQHFCITLNYITENVK
jgi:hypothetical protein